MAISIREVTEIDRRTARRLGLTGEKVNEVIGVWAEEYLKFERENATVTTAVPAPVKRAPAKKAAAKKATTTKAVKPPRTRQSIGKEATATEQPPTEGAALVQAEGSPS